MFCVRACTSAYCKINPLPSFVSIVDIAVPTAASAVFSMSGQMCIAASRLYVQADIYDEFVKKAVEHAKKIKVGDPSKPDTTQGPQVFSFKAFIYILVAHQQTFRNLKCFLDGRSNFE